MRRVTGDTPNDRYGKKGLVIIILILNLMIVLAATSARLSAEEAGRTNTSVLTNIGFMKDPPKELREKFPMCDAFLKVEWIDKSKKIGYSRYDFYGDGKKQSRKAFALIHLDESRPHFDYDLSIFQGKGKIGIKKVFSIVKNGKVFFNTNYLSIEYEDNAKRLDFDTIACAVDTCEFTLADNRINVCISYPDNQRAWIAEGKRIDKVFSEEDATRIVAKIRTYVPSPFPLHVWHPEDSYIVDLNSDGREDYVSGGKVVYSYGSTYYDMKALWVSDDDEHYGQWSFPPTQKKCELKDRKEWVGGFFLTTDGKNYFLNNKCNLTELTQRGQ
jgi:hypothetical protein